MIRQAHPLRRTGEAERAFVQGPPPVTTVDRLAGLKAWWTKLHGMLWPSEATGQAVAKQATMVSDKVFVGLRWIPTPAGLDRIRWDVFQALTEQPGGPVEECWQKARESGEMEQYRAALGHQQPPPGSLELTFWHWSQLGVSQRSEGPTSWEALMAAFGPDCGGPRLAPVAFAAEWVERLGDLAPARNAWYVLAPALLFLFELTHKAGPLQGHPAAKAAWERVKVLREACFEHLSGDQAAEFAEEVCDHFALAQDEAGLSVWEARAEAAGRDPNEEEGPWRLVLEASWPELLSIQVTLHDEDPLDLSLAGAALQAFEQAAALCDRDLLAEGLAAYESALQRFLPHNEESRLLQLMMRWGQASCLDRMGRLEDAWRTLCAIFAPGGTIRVPLRFFLTWLRSSVIVAARTRRTDELGVLLSLLLALASRRLPQAHETLRDQFVELLEGTFEELSNPHTETALEWLDANRSRFEPEGSVLLPLRTLRFQALVHLLRQEEAETEARAVLAWAEAEGQPGVSEGWKEMLLQARESFQDPYNLARLSRSLEHLSEVDQVGEMGRTALMGAAVTGNLVLASRLLDLGADVNAEDPFDWTPLLLAADEGHAAMLRLLAGRGADLEAVTETDQTALHLCAWQNHLEAARVLLELGVDPGATDQDGNTALHLACTEPVPEMIRLLVREVGVELHNDQNGATPLMAAAASGLLDNLTLLLELGADRMAKDEEGDTALDYARLHGRQEAARLLQG